MKVSAKTEYACIAMLELAASFGSGEPVRIRRIAEQHEIPSRFLVQILLQLKGAGLVASTRGAAGGYELIKAPEEITLADVIGVIEGPGDQEIVSSAGSDSAFAQILLATWREITAVQRGMLESLSLSQLLERARSSASSMWHI